VAGLPHAVTDPQKQLEEYITRLQKADVYAKDVELFATPLKKGLTLADTVSSILTSEITKNYLADTLVKGAATVVYLADVLLQAESSKTYLADTIVVEHFIWEDFSNLNDWTVESGTWNASGGVCHQTNTSGVARLQYTGSINFPVDFFFESKIKIVTEGVSTFTGGIFFRIWDWSSGSIDGYLLRLHRGDQMVKFCKIVAGSLTVLAQVSKTIALGTWYVLKGDQRDEGTGIRVKAWFNGEASPSINYLEDPRTSTDGDVGLKTYNAAVDFEYYYQWAD